MDHGKGGVAYPVEIVLGLGANLGKKRTVLSQSVRLLSEGDDAMLTNVTLSPLYESEALMPEGAPESWDISYYNMAIKGITSLKPEEMLTQIKAIEKQLGRRPSDRWAPREIDIDILLWDNTVFDSAILTIPHVGLLERHFALLPVADIVPYWRYPVPGRDYGVPYITLAKHYKHSTSIIKLKEPLSL